MSNKKEHHQHKPALVRLEIVRPGAQPWAWELSATGLTRAGVMVLAAHVVIYASLAAYSGLFKQGARVQAIAEVAKIAVPLPASLEAVRPLGRAVAEGLAPVAALHKQKNGSAVPAAPAKIASAGGSQLKVVPAAVPSGAGAIEAVRLAQTPQAVQVQFEHINRLKNQAATGYYWVVADFVDAGGVVQRTSFPPGLALDESGQVKNPRAALRYAIQFSKARTAVLSWPQTAGMNLVGVTVAVADAQGAVVEKANLTVASHR